MSFPATAHPFIASIATTDIDGTWTFESCPDAPDGPDPDCQEPRGWAYNVIKIENAHQGRIEFTLEGDAQGTQGAASTFLARIVVSGAAGARYVSIDMKNPLQGTGGVEVTTDDTEVYLVISAVPDTFSTYQRYGYRATVTLTSPQP